MESLTTGASSGLAGSPLFLAAPGGGGGGGAPRSGTPALMAWHGPRGAAATRESMARGGGDEQEVAAFLPSASGLSSSSGAHSYVHRTRQDPSACPCAALAAFIGASDVTEAALRRGTAARLAPETSSP